MPRKQKQVPKKKNKSMGLHILGVSLFTLFWVGGNVFLLLSPLYAASFSKKRLSLGLAPANNKMMLVRPDSYNDEQSLVYLVRDRGNYSLYQNGKFLRYEESVVKDDDQDKRVATEPTSLTAKVDISKVEKKVLVRLPMGSTVERSITSIDGKMIVFSVLSTVNFNYLNVPANPDGSSTDVVTVFSYDTEKNVIKKLFSNTDFSKIGYALPKSFSEDNKHIAFDSYECLDCGGGKSKTLVYDSSANLLKDLGPTSDFRWINAQDFEYKELVSQNCESGTNSGICFKNPSAQPFKKGSWK